MKPTKLALLVVDVQRDFCPGGALAVKRGDEIVPRLNSVIDAFTEADLPIFYTMDWHPPDHRSFRAQGGIWPPHCIKGTPGAEFHPSLQIVPGTRIFSKGYRADREAYSGFDGTGLEKTLKSAKVKGFVIGGLTTDYCVKETTLDGRAAGFEVEVLADCIRAVNVKPGDGLRAMDEMKKAGAKLVSSKEAIKLASTQQ